MNFETIVACLHNIDKCGSNSNIEDKNDFLHKILTVNKNNKIMHFVSQNKKIKYITDIRIDFDYKYVDLCNTYYVTYYDILYYGYQYTKTKMYRMYNIKRTMKNHLLLLRASWHKK